MKLFFNTIIEFFEFLYTDMVQLETKFQIDNHKLSNCTKNLPENYNFELVKIINTINKNNSRRIAIQLPDGLLRFVYILVDTIKCMCNVEDVIILGDVVYGACCIDDMAAYNLGCDLLVHFGHSCIIPLNLCKIKCLYVFVDIFFDLRHAAEMIQKVAKEINSETFIINKAQSNNVQNQMENSLQCNKSKILNSSAIKNKIESNHKNFITQKEKPLYEETRLNIHNIYDQITIMGTIQFNAAVHALNKKLGIKSEQIKPLSKGEVLGCTSPLIKNKLACVYIADGRFHLEAIMIKNPNLLYYKYDPFTKTMSREFYDYQKMLFLRKRAQNLFFENNSGIGVIFGTLGQQGSKKILKNIVERLEKLDRPFYIFEFKEINDSMLKSIDFCDSFIQIGCPRLSIDWGHNFCKPLLNSYEFFNDLSQYDLDYFSKEKSQLWNYH